LEDPEILTERLRLSRLTADDAQAMYQYRSDPEVCRYQNFEPGSFGDVEELIGGLQSIAFDTAGTWFQFAIRHRESGLLIGDVGVQFDADDPRQVEIGFTVSRQYQGRGFGSEAVSGLLDDLFGRLEKQRVFASVDPRNESSVGLLKRVGMRREAYLEKGLWFKGEWVDDMVFGISRSEWKDRTGG
jgi:RimJ/RimL family protein N-acetyltransferase